MEDVELTEEIKVKLREEQTRLISIIESFEGLEKSKEWATLKELVFDKSLASIERQLLLAAQEPELSNAKIYKLQGELAWAKKFNDVNRFIETLKKQLADIKKKIT